MCQCVVSKQTWGQKNAFNSEKHLIHGFLGAGWFQQHRTGKPVLISSIINDWLGIATGEDEAKPWVTYQYPYTHKDTRGEMEVFTFLWPLSSDLVGSGCPLDQVIRLKNSGSLAMRWEEKKIEGSRGQLKLLTLVEYKPERSSGGPGRF